MTPRQQEPFGIRYALKVALLFILVSTVLKLASLTFTHAEPDEVIYWTLAEHLLASGDYSLQGSQVLDLLSPVIYDRPLFHHPPLFPALLIPFVALNAPHAAVMLSWLGHALCILAVALMGYVLLSRRSGDRARLRELFWLVLLGVTLDPLLIFISRKLWIDSLLAGLVSLSIALVYLAVHRSGARGPAPGRFLLWAGVVLGLAGLAKLPALLAGVIGLAVIATLSAPWRQRLRAAAFFTTPVVLLLLPWLLLFLWTYGVLMPTWLKPDAWALGNFPLVAEAVGRPWYYYGAKLLLAQPAVLFLLVLIPGLLRGGARERAVPVLWFLLFLSVATFQGLTGYGFQMRYVAMILPSVYVALFCHPLLHGSRRRWAVPVLWGCIFYATLGGSMYFMADRTDEFLTLWEAFGPLRFGAR